MASSDDAGAWTVIDQIPFTDLRLVGAIMMALVLAWWTYERAVKDEPRDPVIRSSMSSNGGSASMLLSGTKAVMTVAGAVAVLLLAPIGDGAVVSDPQPVLLGLGLVTFAHWAVETNEIE